MNELALYKVIVKKKNKVTAVVYVLECSRKLAYLTLLQLLPDHDDWKAYYKRAGKAEETAGIILYKKDHKYKLKRQRQPVQWLQTA